MESSNKQQKHGQAGCQGHNRLTEIAKGIGATAGYFVKGRDVMAKAEKRIIRAPEGYLTAAAALGFLVGMLVPARR